MQNTFSASLTPHCPSSTMKAVDPLKSDSPPYPYIDDSNITSTDESLCDPASATSSHQSVNNLSRISAIRELVETEQRYVQDLRIVADDFIKPLTNGHILNDNEIDQLFINWFSLIAYNSVFLATLQDRVQHKDLSSTEEGNDNVVIRGGRSASMSNIAIGSQASSTSVLGDRHQSLIPSIVQSDVVRRSILLPSAPRCHSFVNPFFLNLQSDEQLGDNIVPQSVESLSTMTITDATSIGGVLCSYLPYMADAYFQYCNCRSQANKYLQAKIDINDQFRLQLELFQERTGGLSLNGFLTKPMQRVTRYPLLIEKILKHTPDDHPDYHSIETALELARQLNERINRKITEQENSHRLDWLQTHLQFGSDENSSDHYLFDELLTFNSNTKYDTQRKLLLHGSLMKVPSGKQIVAFLFNDFLLLSTIKTYSTNWRASLFETKSNLQLRLYRMPLLLTGIITVYEQPNDQLTFSIIMKNQEKPLILRAQQTNLRTLWVRAITTAIEQCQASEKITVLDQAFFSPPNNVTKPYTGVARLTMTIQEANIVPSTKTHKRHRSLNPYCEITINSLTLKTPFIQNTHQPKWHVSMQFILEDLMEDTIHINIFDHEYFSPNENLGYISLQLQDLLPGPLETFITESSSTFTQLVYLNTGSSISIKCVLQIP